MAGSHRTRAACHCHTAPLCKCLRPLPAGLWAMPGTCLHDRYGSEHPCRCVSVHRCERFREARIQKWECWVTGCTRVKLREILPNRFLDSCSSLHSRGRTCELLLLHVLTSRGLISYACSSLSEVAWRSVPRFSRLLPDSVTSARRWGRGVSARDMCTTNAQVHAQRADCSLETSRRFGSSGVPFR